MVGPDVELQLRVKYLILHDTEPQVRLKANDKSTVDRLKFYIFFVVYRIQVFVAL